MAGPFEIATKAALDEIVRRHGQPSKYGAFYSEEALQRLNEELFELLMTSRTLKQAGDRVAAAQAQAQRRPNQQKSAGRIPLPRVEHE